MEARSTLMIAPLLILVASAIVFCWCGYQIHHAIRTGQIAIRARAKSFLLRAQQPRKFWFVIAALACLSSLSLMATILLIVRLKHVGIYSGLP